MLLVRILLGMLPVACFAAPPKFPGGSGRMKLAELMNLDPGTLFVRQLVGSTSPLGSTALTPLWT